MADVLNRDALRNYVNAYWYRPTSDGVTWLANSPININQARQNLVGGDPNWEAVFLRDDVTGSGGGDALHFVRPAYAGSVFKESGVPASDRVLINAWPGLNDCAHFVSESMKAGGTSVYSVNVKSLVEQLRARADTRTLAMFVPVSRAELISKAGIMDTGDIFAYAAADQSFAVHGHSTIFMQSDAAGNARIACHTRLDHPSLSGDWRPYAQAMDDHNVLVHPLVSIIHFAHDEPPSPDAGWLAGWWTVTWNADVYYYYFEGSGRVGYTQTAPANTGNPLTNPAGRGYWFTRGDNILICWTTTGSLERFSKVLPSIPGVSLVGRWNDTDALLAVKMP